MSKKRLWYLSGGMTKFGKDNFHESENWRKDLKEQIEELDLPGISFLSSYKRYYQNDDFASYVLGYVKTTEDGELIGEVV